MDKSTQNQFTSEFWKDIDKQYFSIESTLQYIRIKPYSRKISNTLSLYTQTMISKILKPGLNYKSTLYRMNQNNLKLKLDILFQERQFSTNECQNVLNCIIDKICDIEIEKDFLSAQDTIKGLNYMNDEKQIEMYQKEANILQNLHNKIDFHCKLDDEIFKMEKELKQLHTLNEQELDKQKPFLPEINQGLLYKYNSKQIGEYSIRITRQSIRQHTEELEILQALICLYEDYQLAEGMGHAIFNSQINQVTVTFDKYISNKPINLNLERFIELQKLRDVALTFQETQTVLRSDDIFDMQMCHYCKQMVDIRNMKQCTYNHYEMGLHEYNEDLLVSQRYNISQKKLTKFYQDLYSGNYIIENDIIYCKRYFCYKCLKYEFENYDSESVYWVCPLCKGQCTCSRCIRNDCIYKLKRTYLEIGGELDDIFIKSQFETFCKQKHELIKQIPLDIHPYDEQKDIQKNNNKIKAIKKIKKNKNQDLTYISKQHRLRKLDSSCSYSKDSKDIKDIKEKASPSELTIYLK